jgi:MoaA/NifB/PqqE/SkfB family radical SAM enzyme
MKKENREVRKQVVDITVGYQCNQNCLFCSVGHKRKDLNKSTEQIKKDILKAKQIGVNVLGFGGGEPTMRKDIFELAEFAKKQGFDTIRIQTNGMMLGYRWFAEKIVHSGANYFKISIHGHTPELHDSLTQVKGSFDKAIQGIKNLKKLNQSVEVNIVINKKNYKFLPQIVNFFIGLGITKFCLIYLTVVGNARSNPREIVPKISAVLPYVNESLDIINNLNLDKGLCFNIPICLMQGYEQQLIEMGDFNTLIANPERIEDIDAERKLGKKKSSSCKNCVYDNICFGVWENYTDIFGFEEFKPVLRKNG